MVRGLCPAPDSAFLHGRRSIQGLGNWERKPKPGCPGRVETGGLSGKPALSSQQSIPCLSPCGGSPMTDTQGFRILFIYGYREHGGQLRIGPPMGHQAWPDASVSDDRPSSLARTRPATGAKGRPSAPSRALPPKDDNAVLCPHIYRSMRPDCAGIIENSPWRPMREARNAVGGTGSKRHLRLRRSKSF